MYISKQAQRPSRVSVTYGVSDPAIMGGQVFIKGTRIPVSVVLDNLAVGLSEAEITASYPSLSTDDMRAAIKYGPSSPTSS